jgi:hopene-associated glycosyltransferase HpnB
MGRTYLVQVMRGALRLATVTIFGIIAGAVAMIAWAAMLALRGRFWQPSVAVIKQIPLTRVAFSIAAVMPARNEADVVGDAVTSLLRQSCGSMQVFLVDDASTDGTAKAAEAAVQMTGATGLNVICGKPLPVGWTGKLWALAQGIRVADQASPEWLLLADADIVHGPETVAQLATIAAHGCYDLVSFMVKLHCETMTEKLLIPPYIFFFFMLYPPRWVADPQRNVAGAAGGCILVRREALAHAGGVEAIRGEIIDDCALARLIKRSGGRVWLGLTDESVSVRSYKSATIWRMIARNAFSQLHHSAWLLAGTVAAMCVLYLAPPCLLLSGTSLSITLGAAAWLTMTVAYWPIVRFHRLNPAWALTLPVAALIYTAATLHSALKYWSGEGGKWKGRVQDRAGL